MTQVHRTSCEECGGEGAQPSRRRASCPPRDCEECNGNGFIDWVPMDEEDTVVSALRDIHLVLCHISASFRLNATLKPGKDGTDAKEE